MSLLHPSRSQRLLFAFAGTSAALAFVAITRWASPLQAQTAASGRLTAPLRSPAPPMASSVKPATPAPASPYALSIATIRPEAIYKQGDAIKAHLEAAKSQGNAAN